MYVWYRKYLHIDHKLIFFQDAKIFSRIDIILIFNNILSLINFQTVDELRVLYNIKFQEDIKQSRCKKKILYITLIFSD